MRFIESIAFCVLQEHARLQPEFGDQSGHTGLARPEPCRPEIETRSGRPVTRDARIDPAAQSLARFDQQEIRAAFAQFIGRMQAAQPAADNQDIRRHERDYAEFSRNSKRDDHSLTGLPTVAARPPAVHTPVGGVREFRLRCLRPGCGAGALFTFATQKAMNTLSRAHRMQRVP